MEKYDLMVVGGGPGGYPAAIRASQLGMRVSLVEKNRLGGECTNYGCVPTKVLLRHAFIIYEAQKIGIKVAEEFPRIIEASLEVSRKVSDGVSYLLKRYGIDVFYSEAEVEEKGDAFYEKNNSISARKLILATGTDPSDLGNIRADGELVHNNRTILTLREKPSRVLIIGGGYVGVEYSTFFSSIGSEVTLVEIMPTILPSLDKEVSRLAERSLRKRGVRVLKKTSVKSIKKRERYIVADLGNSSEEFDIAFISVGRRLVLPNVNVGKDERGFIKVDKYLRTSKKNVFASGDITGNPMLAHKAFLQGVQAAESASGLFSEIKYVVPSVIFSSPEIFAVGFTLDQAREKGIEAKETKLPLGGLAASQIKEEELGLIKVVYEDKTKKVIGVHAMSPNASELALSATLAVRHGITLDELSFSTPPHPTMSESMKEVAELALGRPIHYFKG